MNRLVLGRFALAGALLAATAIPLYVWSLEQGHGIAVARTIVLAHVGCFHQFLAFGCRSLNRPFWASRPAANPWLFVAVAFNLALLLLVIYGAPLRAGLHTAPIPTAAWPVILAASLAGLAGVELEKALRRSPSRPPARSRRP